MSIKTKYISLVVVLILASHVSFASETRWSALNLQVTTLYEQANLKDALTVSKKALKQAEIEFGAVSPEMALSLNNIALINKLEGNYDQAIKYYDRALAMAERLLGKEHPDLVVILNNLAFLYKAQGKQAQVNKIYTRLHSLSFVDQGMVPSKPTKNTVISKSIIGRVANIQGNIVTLRKKQADSNGDREVIFKTVPSTLYEGIRNVGELEFGSKIAAEISWDAETDAMTANKLILIEKVMPESNI